MVPGRLFDRHSRMVLAVEHDQVHTTLILPPQLLHHGFSGRRQSCKPAARLNLCLHTDTDKQYHPLHHALQVVCWSVSMPESECNVPSSSGSQLGTHDCKQISRLACSAQACCLTGLYCYAAVSMH